MSQSSLPDIFRKGKTQPLTIRKQGGPFSLHITSSSSDRFVPSRAGYAPGDQNYATITCSKFRSASTASVRPKRSILKDESNQKIGSARQKNQVLFNNEADFWTISPRKHTKVRTVINNSNFPYETNRKMNNMTIDLEQSQSLKNKTEFNLHQLSLLDSKMQQLRESTKQIKAQLNDFIGTLSKDIEYFDYEFTGQMNECYQKLSKLRRITNTQLKVNKTQIDKLQDQIHICTNFTTDLFQKNQEIYQECLATNDKEESCRAQSPYLDFQMSSIPKTSRGATGDNRSRIKIIELLRKNESQSRGSDLYLPGAEDGKMRINGKEVVLADFEDC